MIALGRHRIRHGRLMTGCPNTACHCHATTVVCDEWMGFWGDDWCPRCGWNRAAHPHTGYDPDRSLGALTRENTDG